MECLQIGKEPVLLGVEYLKELAAVYLPRTGPGSTKGDIAIAFPWAIGKGTCLARNHSISCFPRIAQDAEYSKSLC